jgi:hypothetical protein
MMYASLVLMLTLLDTRVDRGGTDGSLELYG